MQLFTRFMFYYPILGRLAIYILVPIILIIILFYAYLLKSVPAISETINLDSLQHEVSISRGKFSIPSIVAKNDMEALSALGYAHAQDRLWQMEVNRRIVAGRISEVIGVKGLGSDKYMRTLGLYRDTQMLWEKLEPETKELILAYANGVNASIKNYAVLPPEFLYFNVRPEPWTVYDSLSIIESMAWAMSGNHTAEIKRTSLLDIFGRKKAADLMPEVSGADIDIASNYLHNIKLTPVQNLAALDLGIATLGMDRSFAGSNNWVVSGRHSQTGLPLLASDPHLQTGSPSVWYIASVKGHQLNVVGATFPGFPFVILGHNASIGWGITNMGADVQDIRLERIDVKNQGKYLKDNVPNDILTRTEYIDIKPDFLKKTIAPVPIAIRETANGPMMSDVAGGLDGATYSISWAGKLGLAGSVDGFRKINYASNWESFRDALRNYTAPAQNFIFADTAGNIGYIGAGKIPIRKKGNGSFPVPGWSSEYDWNGFIPFEELPQNFNPPSGVIITANNKIVSDAYPYQITSDWAPAYRADRIKELISNKVKIEQKLSVDDFRQMQGDTTSLAAKKIIPYFEAIQSELQNEKAALEYIKAWDGNLSSNSVAGTIFEAWIKNLNRSILEDEIDTRALNFEKKQLVEYIIENPRYDFLVDVLNGKNADWCDYKRTEVVETCNEILIISLQRTLTELKKIAGNDMTAWHWGAIHKTQYPHYPFSKSDFSPFFPYGENKFLHFLAHRHAESGGDENTINVAPANGKDGNTKFQQFWAASYRQVIDLSNLNNSSFMISPGQSGNFLSPHYDDLKTAHQNLLLIPIENANKKSHALILK